MNEVRAVVAMPDGRLWLSTDTEGVLHYDGESVVAFGEASGLPTTVMAYRGLTLDRHGRLCVGTAEGTVYSRDALPAPTSTPPPVMLRLTSDGHRLGIGEAPPRSLPSNAGLSGRFVTLAYPGSGIDYQYRLLGSSDKSWTVAAADSDFQFSRLSFDDYRYHSAIYIPFELAGRQQLVLCVYSIYKNAFDEQVLMMLQLLTDYLAMAARSRLGERERTEDPRLTAAQEGQGRSGRMKMRDYA